MLHEVVEHTTSMGDSLVADEALPPVEVEDSHVCHEIGNTPPLPYDGLTMNEALPPLGLEDACFGHGLAHDTSDAKAYSWHPRHAPRPSRFPDNADETELDAIFAGKAETCPANILDEEYCGLAGMSHGQPARPLEAEWLADTNRATSRLDKAST